MGNPTLNTTLHVLDREPRADSWLRIRALSAEHGMLDCMQRLSKRGAAKLPPVDLFDEVRAVLETSNQGRTWFVKEAAIVHRRARLGNSYAALAHACRFARVIADNPLPEESRAAATALLGRAGDAFEAGIRPDAVYFKSLFLIARDEGYPVREEWRQQLPDGDGACADAILREPAANQTTHETDVARCTAALESYLAEQHGFRFALTG